MTGIVAEHSAIPGCWGERDGAKFPATREYLVRVIPARMISQRDLPG
jgi:hypothetical protein